MGSVLINFLLIANFDIYILLVNAVMLSITTFPLRANNLTVVLPTATLYIKLCRFISVPLYSLLFTVNKKLISYDPILIFLKYKQK